MPYGFRRRASYNGDQPPARHGKPTPAAKPLSEPQPPLSVYEEPMPPSAATTRTNPPPEPGYTTAPKWTDSAGKTRTWVLRDPQGSHVAEITAKRDAEKLAKLLNEITGQSR